MIAHTLICDNCSDGFQDRKVGSLRKRAQANGWIQRNGRDYCRECCEYVLPFFTIITGTNESGEKQEHKFLSISDAAAHIGVSRFAVSRAVNNERYKVKGWTIECPNQKTKKQKINNENL